MGSGVGASTGVFVGAGTGSFVGLGGAVSVASFTNIYAFAKIKQNDNVRHEVIITLLLSALLQPKLTPL